MDGEYLDWRLRGLCSKLKPEVYDKLFFPKRTRKVNQAKDFCNPCPVKDKCLAMALEHDLEGIWAGTTKMERSNLKIKDRRVIRQTALVFH